MKNYTAKQVALEVLKKAEECLRKSELLKKAHSEKDQTPPDGVKAQMAPEKNPKEIKEKNNEPTGMADKEDKRLKKAESKHDRCAEHVKENSPEVKNPHAVCVAEGVKPAAWKKSESVSKLAKFIEDRKSKRLSKGENNG